MDDGCLGVIAGCFLWIGLFIIAYVFIHLFVGIFWIALVGALAILVVFGIIKVLIDLLIKVLK